MPRGFAGCRTDANHGEIVSALRQCGYFVLSLASVGNGCPDLLVVSKTDSARVLLLEVKTATGRMTEDEKVFFETYPGRKCVVRTPEQAVETMICFDAEVME